MKKYMFSNIMCMYSIDFWKIDVSVTDIESLTYKTQPHLSITRISAMNQLVSCLFSFSRISRQQVPQHGARWNEVVTPNEGFSKTTLERFFVNFGGRQMRSGNTEEWNNESRLSQIPLSWAAIKCIKLKFWINIKFKIAGVIYYCKR